MNTSSQKVRTTLGFIEQYGLQYYFPCLQYILLWTIYYLTDQPAFLMAVTLTIPYLGKLLPNDSSPVHHSLRINSSIKHVFPLLTHLLFTWTTLAYLFIEYPIIRYTINQCIYLTITIALVISATMDTSHQLIHRPEKICRILGFLNLVIFQFTVYPIEHIYLHHKMVGTSEDPITSPKNKSVYAFTINAYFSAHRFAYKWSKKSFLVCMLTNWTYICVLMFFAVRQEGKWELALWKVSYFMLIGAIGILLFETGEYIEHYGLIYRDKDGEINELASWNTEHNMINNWLMFRFQRHSDHHMNAHKLYSTLELTQKMPKFPFNFYEGGYIAFTPPLWYFVMNPYVDQVIQGKILAKTHEKIVFYIKEAVSFALVVYVWMQASKYIQL